MAADLIRHPASSGALDLAIRVEAARAAGGVLALRYVVTGGLGEVRLPPTATPQRADGLWRTTCFEAFVADRTGAYVELNLSPTTAWAVYAFSGRRQGMAAADVRPPRTTIERVDGRFELGAEAALTDALVAEQWRVGVTAMIEDVEGRISYWALAHPGDKPDFHHPDSFVLELPVP